MHISICLYNFIGDHIPTPSVSLPLSLSLSLCLSLSFSHSLCLYFSLPSLSLSHSLSLSFSLILSTSVSALDYVNHFSGYWVAPDSAAGEHHRSSATIYERYAGTYEERTMTHWYSFPLYSLYFPLIFRSFLPLLIFFSFFSSSIHWRTFFQCPLHLSLILFPSSKRITPFLSIWISISTVRAECGLRAISLEKNISPIWLAKARREIRFATDKFSRYLTFSPSNLYSLLSLPSLPYHFSNFLFHFQVSKNLLHSNGSTASISSSGSSNGNGTGYGNNSQSTSISPKELGPFSSNSGISTANTLSTVRPGVYHMIIGCEGMIRLAQ